MFYVDLEFWDCSNNMLESDLSSWKGSDIVKMPRIYHETTKNRRWWKTMKSQNFCFRATCFHLAFFPDTYQSGGKTKPWYLGGRSGKQSKSYQEKSMEEVGCYFTVAVLHFSACLEPQCCWWWGWTRKVIIVCNGCNRWLKIYFMMLFWNSKWRVRGDPELWFWFQLWFWFTSGQFRPYWVPGAMVHAPACNWLENCKILHGILSWDGLQSLSNPAQEGIGLICKYYLGVQTCYPIAKHRNKGYSELMAYVTACSKAWISLTCSRIKKIL